MVDKSRQPADQYPGKRGFPCYFGWIKAAARGPLLELWPHGLINILVNIQALKAQIHWPTDRYREEALFCLALD